MRNLKPILLCWCFSIVILIANDSYGQFLSKNLRFEATIVQGCEGMTVKVTNRASLPTGATVLYDSLSDGDNIGFSNDTIFNYVDTTGVFLIVQNIGTTTSSLQDTLEIEVYPPDPPEFRVLNCENRNSTVSIEPDFYSAYRVFFTPNDSVDVLAGDPVPVYTYPDTNPRTITVKGIFPNGADNCGASTKTFSPVNNLQVADLQDLTVDTVDPVNGSIAIDYSLGSNITYRLEIASGQGSGFVPVGLLDDGSSSYMIEDLDTENSFYCLRIVALDTCNPANNLTSNTLCSIALQLTPENNQQQLQWETGSNFAQFQIEKDGQLLTSLPGSEDIFFDTQVVCGTNYCYQLVGTTNSGAISRSASACDTAFSTDVPPPVESLVSNNTDNGIQLVWSPPSVPVNIYQIYRRESGGNFELIAEQNDTSFIDRQSDQDTEVCYQIGYINRCDIISPGGNISCPIILSVKNNQEKLKTLEWTAYEGWPGGVSNYEVEKYDLQNNLLETISVGNQREYTEDNPDLDQQVIVYRVKANSGSGEESYSNPVTVRFEAIIHWPNAFSPDGQGDPENEIFNYKSAFIRDSVLKIYNRWGELIFVSENKEEGWNGYYNGVMADPGVYIYVAELQDYQNNTYTERGTFILLRKK